MKDLVRNGWHLIQDILYFICYRIFHLKLSEKQWNAFMQFVQFGIVGVSNTLVSYGIYLISLLTFQRLGWLPRIDYLVAHYIAFFLSVLWSFFWNRKFVFRADNEKVPWPQALLKTYLSYAFTGLFLNSVFSLFWVEIVGIPKVIVPLVTLTINVPINFLLNKFWAFREKK